MPAKKRPAKKAAKTAKAKKPAAKKAIKKLVVELPPAKKRKRAPGAGGSKPRMTLKKELFVENKLGGMSGVQAARAAGYKGNDHTLRQVAYENLTKPDIASRVRARVEGVAATADEVLALLGDHLRADLADFQTCFTDDGKLDLDKAKDLGVSRLVKKFKTHTRTILGADGEPPVREVSVEIELHDSQGAAAKLMDHLGLKQKAKDNDDDVAHAKKMAASIKDEVDRLIKAGWTEDEAHQIILEASPEAARWTQ